MSDTEITMRDLVLAERAAFIEGLNAKPCLGDPWTGSAHEAAKRYPLPKVTRPRVVRDSTGDYWRVTARGFEVMLAGDDQWRVDLGYMAGCEHIRSVAADLLANPTEEVEE